MRRAYQEVVSNLLVNAVSYTGDGGLVSVTVTCGSGEVVVAVRDTGRGSKFVVRLPETAHRSPDDENVA
jgi:K+-sensing histidine kinase KdpD